MSIKFRTIDDLGIDASKQYAQNQTELDRTFLEDSQLVAQKAEIPGISPYQPSSFEEQFSVGRQTRWAGFSKPPLYASTSGRLFTYQLAPSFGGLDEQQDRLDEFKNTQTSLSEKEKKEHDILSHMLEDLIKMGRTFELIQARRSQYHQG